MAYQTYTTDALVCGTFNRNTADRSYLLFTREAGMLYADARSVREERSRQRYALQDFSLLRVSLVKGKSGWRIGSIEPRKNFYQAATDKRARGSVVSVCRLLRRFVKGEEADDVLFDYVVTALGVLAGEVPKRQFVQSVVGVHILTFLGYVDTKRVPAELYNTSPADLSASYDPEAARTIESLYTHAVKISHL